MRRRRKVPVGPRFWSKVDRRGPDECWPWLASVRRKDEGYGAFWMDGRHKPAPRIAYELTHGPIPDGMVACHRCDNPRCCNPAHVFLGQPQDNDADRVAKGRQARGARNGNARLTDRDVWAIRGMRRIGIKPKWLGQYFGITPVHVWSLCNDPDCWRHIDAAAMSVFVQKEWEARRARG